jgi:hypothetical protein
MRQIVKRKIRGGRADDDDGRYEIKPGDPSLGHGIEALLIRIDRAINQAKDRGARGNGIA